MALATGTRVMTKTDTSRTKAGEKGVIVSFDTWSGEEYPYVVSFDDGSRGAYGRHELSLVWDNLRDVKTEADSLLEKEEKEKVALGVSEILADHKVELRYVRDHDDEWMETVVFCRKCGYIDEALHAENIVVEYVEGAVNG